MSGLLKSLPPEPDAPKQAPVPSHSENLPANGSNLLTSIVVSRLVIMSPYVNVLLIFNIEPAPNLLAYEVWGLELFDKGVTLPMDSFIFSVVPNTTVCMVCLCGVVYLSRSTYGAGWPSFYQRAVGPRCGQTS